MRCNHHTGSCTADASHIVFWTYIDNGGVQREVSSYPLCDYHATDVQRCRTRVLSAPRKLRITGGSVPTTASGSREVASVMGSV